MNLNLKLAERQQLRRDFTEQEVVARPDLLAPAPHGDSADTVVTHLDSHRVRGLSTAEAKRRIEQYGPNQLKSAP